MDNLKLQLETVCLISIFAGLISVAIPQGKMKNSFSAFCAAVIIFATVSPVADIKTQGLGYFKLSSENKDEMLLSDVSTAETELYESLLASSIEKELEKAGYKLTVKVYCEKTDDEIRVMSFFVKGSIDKNASGEIEAYLKKGFPDAQVKIEEVRDG